MVVDRGVKMAVALLVGGLTAERLQWHLKGGLTDQNILDLPED